MDNAVRRLELQISAIMKTLSLKHINLQSLQILPIIGFIVIIKEFHPGLVKLVIHMFKLSSDHAYIYLLALIQSSENNQEYLFVKSIATALNASSSENFN